MLEARKIEDLSVSPEEIQYLLIIYGEISVINPHVAFRRSSRVKSETTRENRLKQLKCPHCSTRFADTDVSTKIEIITKPAIRKDPCQLYWKCDTCGAVFGVNIVIVVS